MFFIDFLENFTIFLEKLILIIFFRCKLQVNLYERSIMLMHEGEIRLQKVELMMKILLRAHMTCVDFEEEYGEIAMDLINNLKQ